MPPGLNRPRRIRLKGTAPSYPRALCGVVDIRQGHRCALLASGVELADQVADFIDEYNAVRPHQALDQTPPLEAYLHDRTLKPNPPRSEQES